MAVLERGNWQTATSSVRERTKVVFNNEFLSDVKFVVRVSIGKFNETKVIPAHKFVLSISSPVFLVMFYGEMAETGDSVELPDCEYDGLLELLRYMYSDEVNLTGNNVMHVLYLAKKYIVPSLADKCVEYLQENLEASNAFCILQYAEMFWEKDLVEDCWDVIETRTEEVVKSDEFVTLERSLVESVVKRDFLNVTEVELFQAIDRWATVETERQGLTLTGPLKRQVLGEEIVKAIRFPLMSKDDFVAVVDNSNILTKSEIVEITSCSIDENENIPSYISTSFIDVPTSPSQFHKTPRSGISTVPQRCCRFQACSPPAGLWRYWGGVDSFTFSINKAIKLCGVRLFGSKGNEYAIRLKIKRASDGSKVAKKSGSYNSDKDPSDGHYGFDVLLDRPARLRPGEVYEAEASIEGPRSWYGTNGMESVQGPEVTFVFGETVFDSNGTNVQFGQFHTVLFDG